MERRGARQHDVGVLLEQVAREPHRVSQGRHLRDGTRAAVACHDAGVHAGHAIRLQIAAGARVQKGLFLEMSHGGFSRIECAAARLQHRPAGIRGPLGRRHPRTFFTSRRRPAAAMHHQSRGHTISLR